MFTAPTGYWQTHVMPLHPQAQSVVDLMAALDTPPIETQTPEAARAARAALVQPSMLEVGAIRDLDADGVPVRLYVPPGAEERVTGALVWFHGGGWVLGSIEGHDDLCRELCLASGHRVLSVGYRLAPEDPFPAGLDDARTSLSWIAACAGRLGIDPGRLAIGGDSAGANLAAVITHDPPVTIRYQALVYPVTDATRGSDSYRRFRDGPFLTATAMAWFVEQYLSGELGDPGDPRVSPLLADDAALAAAPPTLVITAECDPLRDEGVEYARRLATVGVATSHVEFAGQIHGFLSMGDLLDDAHAARGLIGGALARALAAPDPSP